MRYILLLLSLAGCSTIPRYTPESLGLEARQYCEKTKQTEESKMYCSYAYVVGKCKGEWLDVRICGEIKTQ